MQVFFIIIFIGIQSNRAHLNDALHNNVILQLRHAIHCTRFVNINQQYVFQVDHLDNNIPSSFLIDFPLRSEVCVCTEL